MHPPTCCRFLAIVFSLLELFALTNFREQAALGQTDVVPTYDRDQVSRAAANGIELLRQSTDRYPTHRDCFSCHHQSLPLAALRIHASRKVDRSRESSLDREKVDWGEDQNRIERILDLTRTSLRRQIDALHPGEELDGRGLTLGYALWTLELGRDEDVALKSDLLRLALDSQHENGSWRIHSHRPPAASSELMATALVCAGLETNQQRLPDESVVLDALCRARWWVWNQSIPETTENMVGILGCERVLERLDRSRHNDHPSKQRSMISPWDSWTETHLSRDQLETLADRRKDHGSAQLMQALWNAQNPDGGWGQTFGEDSDSYATGLSLNAILDDSGTTDAGKSDSSITEDPRFRRGLHWLLQNQHSDGSWHVSSRCIPVQEYFDNGDPYETDQFISIMGTAWATAALCRTIRDLPDLLAPNAERD